jgi:hypothetical protein
MMVYEYALIVVGFKVLNVGFRVYMRVFRCPRIWAFIRLGLLYRIQFMALFLLMRLNTISFKPPSLEDFMILSSLA